MSNPFGREMFEKSEKGAVVVQSGESRRVRFDAFVHGGLARRQQDLAADNEDYKHLAE